MATAVEGLSADRAGASTGKTDRELGNPVLLALIWLCGASAFLLLLWGSKLSFLLDDWEFLIYRRGFNAHAILEPHGEHISIAPVLIYKALLATVGMGSALPFRVVSTGLFILSAVLFFVLLLRRVGQWPALAATVLVLFVGAAWEDLLWAFQIGYFGSMAAGLGMLLALEREDARGDRLACLLLTVSIVFSSLGIPFAAAAVVAVLLQPERRRRLYVFLIPLLLYAAWWLGWGHNAESAISAANVGKTPSFVADGFASSMTSIFGLFGPERGGLGWGRPLAVAAIVLAVWRLNRLGRASTWLWVLLALGGSFWILAGLNQIPGRTPESSRYQYIGVIFTLLLAAELLRGVRFGWRALAAGFVVVAAITVSNIGYLHAAWESYRQTSQLEKADLGAVEIARGTVEPGFVLSEDIAGTAYVHIEAGPYLSARDAFGSPAYDQAELAVASEPARLAADRVLFAALRVSPRQVASHPRSPSPAAADNGLVTVPRSGCVSVPGGAEPRQLSLPPGGVVLQAGGRPVTGLGVERFSTGAPPIKLESVGPGRSIEIPIPTDRSRVPWRLEIESAGTAVACGVG
ncbi:MAG TPA: hypothetical protein VF009_00425 [Solirubrobacterales bacterium]